MACSAIIGLATGNGLEPETVLTEPERPSATPHSQGVAAGRLLPWILCAVVSIYTVGHIAWAQMGILHSASGTQSVSVVRPLTSVLKIIKQLSSADLFTEFNVPVRSILCWIVWLTAVVPAGRVLLQCLRIHELMPDESLVFSFALGFTVIGTATLGVGLISTSPVVLATLMLVFLLVGIIGWRGVSTDISETRRALFAERSRLQAFCMVAALIALLAAFLVALTPPIQTDGMRYHLGAPQEYLKNGRIGFLPLNAFSNFPFLVEMHFLLGLAARAPEMSQLVHFTLYLFTSLGIAASTRRLSEQAGVVLPHAMPMFMGTIYLLIPASMILASWPNIDHGTAFFFLLSTQSLLLAMRFRTPGLFVLAGTTAGAAFATKYTAAPHVLLLAVVAVGWFFLHRKDKASGQHPLRFSFLIWGLFAATTVAGPWLAKNYAFTANPIYPLAGSFFQQREWTPANAALYQQKAQEKGSGKSVAELPLSPIKATFRWPAYESHNVGAWPLVLLLSGFAALVMVWRSSRKSGVAFCLFVALFYWLTWFYSYQSNRMLLPFMALMLPVAAVAFTVMSAAHSAIRQFLCVSLLASALHGAAWAIQWMYAETALSKPPLPYLLGGMDRDYYERKALNYAAAFKILNERVKPGEKVLLIGEHRIYGARFSAYWSDWYDVPAIAQFIQTYKVQSAEELNHALRGQASVVYSSTELPGIQPGAVSWIYINIEELRPQLEAYFKPRFTGQEWKVVQYLLSGDVEGYEKIPVPGDGLILRLK